MAADIDAGLGASTGIMDLLRALSARLSGIERTQDELREGQKEMNKHLAQLNGHVARNQEQTIYLKDREKAHSDKLKNHDGVLADLLATTRTVMAVSRTRDEYQARDIGEIKFETRGWQRDLLRSLLMALVIAVVLLVALALLLATAGLI